MFAWSFSNFYSSSSRLFNVLCINHLGISFKSTSFVYGRLKLKQFGIILNILQLRKCFISSSAFPILMDNVPFVVEILQHFHVLIHKQYKR